MTKAPRYDLSQLLQAVAFVATGAFVGIWAPPGLMGVMALLMLMRICWLEDNITNDLIGQDKLPGGYVNTAIRRGNLIRRILGRDPTQDVTTQSPHQLATGMRAEIQVWACMLLGLVATVTAQFAPFGPVMNLLVAAMIFAMALRRVDKLLVSLAHCAEGRALPQRLLLPSRPWVLRDPGSR